MRIRIAFVDYGNPGDMPNVVAAIDEYLEDEHMGLPEFYETDIKTAKSGGFTVREMFVTIPDSAVLALFEPPTIEGTVDGAT